MSFVSQSLGRKAAMSVIWEWRRTRSSWVSLKAENRCEATNASCIPVFTIGDPRRISDNVGDIHSGVPDPGRFSVEKSIIAIIRDAAISAVSLQV